MMYGILELLCSTVAKETDKENIVQLVAAERRKILPSPEVASGDIGLWSILRKNIGEWGIVIQRAMCGCVVL